MNKLVIICALLLGVTGVVTAQKSSAKNADTTTVFAVETMHGDHCRKRIEGNIAFEKGVKDLKVDLEKQTVTVTYNPRKNSDEKLIAAFEKLGYSAKIVGATAAKL
ncbi:heavy-metal-associated domain-containing protein [Candidatus Symbiothrix dinenymphae]|uniref:heavy-metal-associated domain-containing protein n=1 Tax=Candidatus Symbiothrix dinenymphae TaxID=467085 RepID=UPI0006C6EC3D|nr:heavy-metal-associated domain-containing protein [Candidatus Symbiothrix dinenymphae]GAP71975.1 hypothetical protein SAMD00024442_21_18 [Candidatus Symbiothrix dinenymphae]